MCCPARQEGPPERSLACRPPAEVAALAPVVATAWGLQQPFAVVGLGSPEHIVALPGCTSRPALAPPGSSRRARLGQGAPASCSLQIASMPAKKNIFCLSRSPWNSVWFHQDEFLGSNKRGWDLGCVGTKFRIQMNFIYQKNHTTKLILIILFSAAGGN